MRLMTLICLLLFTVDAVALTGNEWNQLPEAAQQSYFFGVTDGWANVTQFVPADE